MTAQLEGIVRVVQVARYDGTNGQEVFDLLEWSNSSFTFVSDTGGILTVNHSIDGNRTYQTGDHLPHNNDGGPYMIYPAPNDNDFPDRWVKVSDLT